MSKVVMVHAGPQRLETVADVATGGAFAVSYFGPGIAASIHADLSVPCPALPLARWLELLVPHGELRLAGPASTLQQLTGSLILNGFVEVTPAGEPSEWARRRCGTPAPTSAVAARSPADLHVFAGLLW